MRMEFLREALGHAVPDEEGGIRDRMERYFRSQTGTGFFAFLAEVDGQVVSTVYCALSDRPASPTYYTGKAATVLNVYTRPDYRRRGIAAALLRETVAEARRLGVSELELTATPDGKPLYEKFGFVEPKYTYMQLKLKPADSSDE